MNVAEEPVEHTKRTRHRHTIFCTIYTYHSEIAHLFQKNPFTQFRVLRITQFHIIAML